MPKVIPPVPDRDDEFFWDGVAQGKLLLRRCASCGTIHHPPIPMCGDCNALEWELFEPEGRGIVYSWIMSRHPTEPDAEPRIVALVELTEGVRVVSNLVDIAVDEVRNEMPVELCFRTYGDVTLPQFRPVGG